MISYYFQPSARGSEDPEIRQRRQFTFSERSNAGEMNLTTGDAVGFKYTVSVVGTPFFLNFWSNVWDEDS